MADRVLDGPGARCVVIKHEAEYWAMRLTIVGWTSQATEKRGSRPGTTRTI